MPSNRLEILLSGNVRDFNQKMRAAEKTADDAFGSIGDKARDLSLVLGGMAVSGGAIVKSFLDSAVQMEKYEQTLKAITGSTKAARAELEKYTKFAATTPFDLPGVVEAATKMRALKVDVDRFLPLAGDLAAVFDRKLPDAALALSKALSGSQDGLTQLQDSFGVTKKELEDAGAIINQSTKAIDVSRLDELQAALQKVISTKFGGTMKAQADSAAGAFSNLEDAFGRLKASLGAELKDDFAGLAKELTALLDSFNSLPGPTKRMLAQTVALGTAVAGLAAIIAGGVAVFGPLAAKIAAFSAAAGEAAIAAEAVAAGAGVATAANFGFTAATVGSVTALDGLAAAGATAGAVISASIPILGAVAVGLALYTHHLGKVNVESEELRKKQEAAAQLFREQRGLVLDAASALKQYAGDAEKAGDALAKAFKDAGKTEVDASKAIAGLVDQLNQAQSSGDESVAKSIRERISALRYAKDALAGTYKQQKDAEKAKAEATKKAANDSAAAVADYKKKASSSYFETAKAQLAALDKVLKGVGKENADRKDLVLSRVALARKVAEEETKAEEDARKKRVEGRLRELDKIKAYGDDRLGAQKSLIQKILGEEKLSSDERGRLEVDLISVTESIRDKAAKKKKEADEKAKRDADELSRLKIQSTDAQKRAVDVEIQALEQQLAQGKDVTAQIKEQIAARRELEEAAIREEAAASSRGKSGNAKVEIEKKAQAEISAIRSKATQEVDALDLKSAEQKKKAQLELIKLEQELLQTKLDSTKNLKESDIVGAAKERLQLGEAQLRLEADIAAQQASPEEKVRIAAGLENDIYNLRKQSTAELAKATEEFKKQKALRDAEKKGATLGGIQTLDQFVQSTNDQFASQRQTPESPAGNSEQRAAQQLGVNPNASAPIMSPEQFAQLSKALTVKVEIVAPPSGQADKGWLYKFNQT